MGLGQIGHCCGSLSDSEGAVWARAPVAVVVRGRRGQITFGPTHGRPHRAGGPGRKLSDHEIPSFPTPQPQSRNTATLKHVSDIKEEKAAPAEPEASAAAQHRLSRPSSRSLPVKPSRAARRRGGHVGPGARLPGRPGGRPSLRHVGCSIPARARGGRPGCRCAKRLPASLVVLPLGQEEKERWRRTGCGATKARWRQFPPPAAAPPPLLWAAWWFRPPRPSRPRPRPSRPRPRPSRPRPCPSRP